MFGNLNGRVRWRKNRALAKADETAAFCAQALYIIQPMCLFFVQSIRCVMLPTQTLEFVRYCCCFWYSRPAWTRNALLIVVLMLNPPLQTRSPTRRWTSLRRQGVEVAAEAFAHESAP